VAVVGHGLLAEDQSVLGGHALTRYKGPPVRGVVELDEALSRGTPAVFNTDQGVQFTARAWTSRVERAGARVSMDGTGRCLDNVFVERLWRSVKYEYVYPSGPASVRALERGLCEYFGFYNEARVHQALEYRTPAQVHRAESRRSMEG
jgi:putative transposase